MENITITEKTNFIEISANTGYMLTDYDANTQDVKGYYGTKIVCAPKSIDIASKYHTITVEEHNALNEAKEKALEEEERELFEKEQAERLEKE